MARRGCLRHSERHSARSASAPPRFGAKRLPEMARSLGSSVVEFKKAINETAEAVKAQPGIGAAQTDNQKAAAEMRVMAQQLMANPATAEAGRDLAEKANALEAKV